MLQLPAALCLFASVLCSSCQAPSRGTRGDGVAWPEADDLFHREPRWIGGDAALTIPLDSERTLWLWPRFVVVPMKPRQ